MKVLVLSNNKFEVKEIENELEELQKIVGGYIEIPHLSRKFFENDIDIIINEVGKFIEGLKPEIAVVNRDNNKVVDIVFGNCIFTSHDEEGNTTELTEEQMRIVLKELQTEIILSNNADKNFVCKALFI